MGTFGNPHARFDLVESSRRRRSAPDSLDDGTTVITSDSHTAPPFARNAAREAPEHVLPRSHPASIDLPATEPIDITEMLRLLKDGA